MVEILHIWLKLLFWRLNITILNNSFWFKKTTLKSAKKNQIPPWYLEGYILFLLRVLKTQVAEVKIIIYSDRDYILGDMSYNYVVISR